MARNAKCKSGEIGRLCTKGLIEEPGAFSLGARGLIEIKADGKHIVKIMDDHGELIFVRSEEDMR